MYKNELVGNIGAWSIHPEDISRNGSMIGRYLPFLQFNVIIDLTFEILLQFFHFTCLLFNILFNVFDLFIVVEVLLYLRNH